MFTHFIALILLILTTMNADAADMSNNQKNTTKLEIMTLAESFKGQGDPDRSKQKQLEAVVDKLLEIAPQKTVTDRLNLIQGAWQQIWGPYDYRSDDRGVDPSIDVHNIYQVVFPGGYYYNVNPDPTKDKLRIGLLRGEYALVPDQPNHLNVRFTKFDQLKGCPPDGLGYTDLPQKSEEGKLKNSSWLLPSFFVRWFFDGGTLREVYTDEDLRIAFGSSSDNLEKNHIYVLKRVTHTPISGC